MAYKNYTDVEWRKLIQEFKNSGLSNAEFIRTQGIEKNKFYKMKKKFENEVNSLAPIQLVEVVCDRCENQAIKISKNGFQIEYTKDIDKLLLKELLGIMNDI